MKFPINTVIKINDCDWKVEEYRLGRGREWVYTLSTDGQVEGSFETMRLNETAIRKITSLGKENAIEMHNTEEVFA
tara:strand:+ start:905 stop:1132 length:228 start_codon:yes stop_codon:yes gene_type:complete